jgi:long-chain acyl-CoA synthetase
MHIADLSSWRRCVVTTSFTNLVELGESSCARFSGRPLFGTKRDGRWEWITYGEFQRLVDDFRGGLAGIGVEPGDRVAIIADNRVEWAVAAYATYGLEATFVPMYRSQLAADWQYILADCGAKVVLAATSAIVAALEAMRPALPSLTHIVTLEGAGDGGQISYAALLARGRARPVPSQKPGPDDVAGFLYTSGTTGKPKGVVLSHRNLSSNVAAATAVFPIAPEDRSLSFLPWAHAYGQVVELHILTSMGASTAFNDELPRLLENLAEVKPTILVAVPRIFNKMYQAVTLQIAARPAVVRWLFGKGMAAARRRNHGEAITLGARLALWLCDWLIFSKVRARFGGRLRYAITASAAISRDVGEFIDALGIPVYEGYGLSETSPVVAANCPGARRMGSVGRVLPGVRVTIDETASLLPGEGEIVVHGPNVMLRYHDRPEETAVAIDTDGGLRTGDLGRLDDDGYLYITGRIKEQYKLENGKYVMPTPLEEQLKLSPYISSVMLYGANRPYNVALVVPNLPAIREWADRHGKTLGEPLVRDETVRELLWEELERQGANFRPFERPQDFVLVEEDFSADNGLLTPTLKLRRQNAVARYGAALEALYPPPALRFRSRRDVTLHPGAARRSDDHALDRQPEPALGLVRDRAQAHVVHHREHRGRARDRDDLQRGLDVDLGEDAETFRGEGLLGAPPGLGDRHTAQEHPETVVRRRGDGGRGRSLARHARALCSFRTWKSAPSSRR